MSPSSATINERNKMKARITIKTLTALIRAAGLSEKGDWSAVKAWNNAHATASELRALRSWSTNTPKLRGDMSLLKVSHRTFLFGGTGNCGNRWPAPAGGWYPTAAVIRFGRGLPKLVAATMDWY